ncbi:DM13 domain-containing protein [Crossiella sp. SN42]|nr:DM13 domain-containing protein [Crossiella sp. SN42]MCO1581565.1 DM13 domain-containing protein [Crossiella sp. SN42]
MIVATVLGVGLYLFQPWKLFTSSTVDEALPTGAAAEAPLSPATSAPGSGAPGTGTPGADGPGAGGPGTGAPGAGQPGATTPPAQPGTLAAGDFVSQEHPTKGKAAVLRLADGSRVLRLTGLASSDGPDLHVWLTDQSAGGEWGKYDDGRFVKLGKLKATHGNQNYAIPADANLDGLRSVVIWCDRFNVAFGSAPLTL